MGYFWIYKTHLLPLQWDFESFLYTANFQMYTKEESLALDLRKNVYELLKQVKALNRNVDAHVFVCLKSWISASETSHINTE